MNIDKALQKLKQNKRNWRMDKLITIAHSINITCDASRSKGSHYVFRYDGIIEHLSIPKSADIHPDYITKFIRLIEKVLALQSTKEQTNDNLNVDTDENN